MRRLTALSLMLLVWLPTAALAKGGYMRPPEPKPIESADSTSPAPTPASAIVAACGPKRYPDPQTHHCRGPADFGH